MGAGLNIKYDELDKQITELESLKTKLADTAGSVTRPTKVGGGDTVDKIESLADVYDTLNKSIDDLITSSVAYFKKVKDASKSTGQSAATAISGK